MKIGSRLNVGFIFIFLLLTSLTLFGVNRMVLLSDQTAKMYNHPLTVSNAVLRINTNIIKIHRSMKDVALARDLASIAELSQIVNEHEKEIFKDFEIIRERFLGEKKKYENALEVFTLWKPIRDDVIALMYEGKRDEAVDITKGKGASYVVKIEEAMEILGNFAEGKAVDFLKTVESTREDAFNTMYFLLGLSVTVGIAFAVFLTRSITRPIETMRAAAGKIGKGQLSTTIEIESKDEIGQLADSFNKMIQDLKNITASRDDLNKEITERKEAEEALLQEKHRVEDVSDSVNCGLLLLDEQARITYLNKISEEWFGPFHQNKGKSCWEIFKFKDPEKECAALKVLQTGETVRSDTFIIMSNGEDKYFYIVASPIKDNNGKIHQITEVIVDITEHKRAENKLGESEKRYKALFNYMSSGVAVYKAIDDGKDFVFKDFNKAGERIEKVKREEIIGKRITETFSGVKEFGLLDVFQRVWKTGMSEHHPISLYKDNRISGWRENYVYRLPSGEIVAVYDDVTDRKQTIETLQKRTHDLGERVKELNCLYALSKLVGDPNTSIEEILQDTVELIPPTWQYPEITCARITLDDQIFKTDDFEETPWKQTSYIAAHGKHIGSLEVCYLEERPESDNGPFLKEEGFLINAITEELGRIIEHKWAKAEALRTEHLAALGELAAGVAHEINNPVNGIINYAQILANKSNKESREQEIANRIINEGIRIATIVRSLLSFARDSKEEKRPIHIHEMISEALTLAETQLKKDGINLKVNISPELPRIIAQPQQIEQVFLNVISNAQHALNQKYPRTHKDKILEILGEKATIGNSPHAQITFYDQGTGIPSDILDKVMNPFFSTKPGDRGTGLGLSISQSIIIDHHGKIMLESQEGKFTKVVMDFPAYTKGHG